MYEITFSPRAIKELAKLEHDLRVRIIGSLERIRIRPEAFITKLVGDPAYKFRVGDYRILLEIEHSKMVILVIKVGHRREVYNR